MNSGKKRISHPCTELSYFVYFLSSTNWESSSFSYSLLQTSNPKLFDLQTKIWKYFEVKRKIQASKWGHDHRALACKANFSLFEYERHDKWLQWTKNYCSIVHWRWKILNLQNKSHTNIIKCTRAFSITNFLAQKFLYPKKHKNLIIYKYTFPSNEFSFH